jgi:hypothetical protein
MLTLLQQYPTKFTLIATLTDDADLLLKQGNTLPCGIKPPVIAYTMCWYSAHLSRVNHSPLQAGDKILDFIG